MRAELPEEFAQIMAAAEVARVMAERARLGTSAINRATSIKLQAMAGLAAAVDRGQGDGTIAGHGGDRVSKIAPGNLAPPRRLSDLGVDAKTVRESRLVALADREYGIRALAERAESAGREITRTEVVALGRAVESGITEGQGDDWYTPAWLFDALGLRFDMDVCAPEDPGHRTCPADAYLTEADDGLARPWHGMVWCNPPYSKAAPWVARVIAHGDAVLLTHIPANASWAVDVWRTADAMVPMQALPFQRPNGATYRPGYALMLTGYGQAAAEAVIAAGRLTEKSGSAWVRA